MPSDSELIARVLLDDDRRAFATLVRHHQSAVRALLRRLTGGNAALSDDLAQETFITAYRKLRDFRGGARLSTWLYRIAYNAFVSEMRKRKEIAPENALPDLVTPDNHIILREDVDRALNHLRAEERAALVLTYWQDLSQQEAAAILDCPLGTVKTWSNRGKDHLRQHLVGWEPRNGHEN